MSDIQDDYAPMPTTLEALKTVVDDHVVDDLVVEGSLKTQMDGFYAAKSVETTKLDVATAATTYALGGGTSRTITGPTLPALPPDSEYIWNKTDGAGTLLDIVTGIA